MRNPYKNPFFSKRQSERDAKIIAEGFNPYDEEEMAVFKFRYSKSGDKRVLEDFVAEEGKKENNYSNFISECKDRGVCVENLSEQAGLKRELLRKYFKKFSDEGKQPIASYSDSEIGALFKRVYCFYNRKERSK